ncbi:hypothetical protein BXZ70DRAFT_911531 [Cristinia sonorae]|uniref:Uncharacterized protein n=1 Tax=Cristinia sonorae TaxID=1940300 RepID=A0A8K0XJN2_9AGAR|nr:hypothetical protein BXZ70DRAFT_911531 [Cristinia sonorae]
MAHAWADSTQETYGSGLLAFHTFCDIKGIPEANRTPVDTDLMASFVSTLAGTYAGSTIRNYFAGVRAWHILHRIPWSLDKPTMDAILKAGDVTAPRSSKKKPHKPVLVATLIAIKQGLDLNNPRHAAVWACATCLFYGVA